MKVLNIIGAGRVGRTLAALGLRHQVWAIQCVLNRSQARARDAVAFIGGGSACDDWTALRSADVWLVATPDGAVAAAASRLAASGLLRAGDVVFHCSGALAAAEMNAVSRCGALIASVHPLKSFADATDAVRTFAGTYCAAEGDAVALTVLTPAFEAIGARMTTIDVRYKTLYHAASVMVCNNLTALMEAGLQCYEKAGLPRATATAMMEPLVRETVDNIFRLGTVKALTGPVARGDHAVVTRQLQALSAFDARIAGAYRALGAVAAQLALAQRGAGDEALDATLRALQAGGGA